MAPVFVPALDNHRPRDSLHGPTTKLVTQSAVEAAGLHGDLLAVDGAQVNLRSHHRDPLRQTIENRVLAYCIDP
jgi:hypothetical protein